MVMVMELADKIIRLLDESGATEIEKLATVDVVRCLVPLSRGSVANSPLRPSESEPTQPEYS